MVGILVILALFTSGAILTMIYPIRLPAVVTDGITNLLTPVFAWNGILPVEAIFNCINWTIQILIMYLVYKAVMGIIGMITGSGVPQAD